MSSNFVQNYLGEQLAQRTPSVNRPRVRAPSPFDDTRMDISDRFRPRAAPASPSSFVGSRESDDRDITYTGDINVTGLGVDVEDQFGGLTSGIRTALGPLGLAGIASIGGGISQGALTNIQDKMRQGIPGYGIGMLNGRIVGVSPGGALTGVLPAGLSGLQRQQIANQLLQMNPTTALVGGLIPTKDDPDTPPPTATASVVDKILSGIDPEAAGYEAGLFSDTLGGTVTGRADAYIGQQGGIEPPAAPSVTPVDYYPTADDVINDPYRDVPPGLAVMTEQDFNFGYDPPGDYSYFGDVTSPASQPSDDGGGAPPAAQSEPEDDSNPEDYGGSSTSFSDTGGFGPAGFRAKGGRVGMADGGSADPVQGNGFVEGSPDNYTKKQTIADDEYRRVRPGSFIMNAPMTEKLQEAGLLPKGVDNPAKKSTIKANKGGMIDVALSKGEYVFEPEEAREIGYDVLNKINDMGKPEVDRRQAMGHGGMTGTKEEVEAALTGTPTPAPTNFQNIILQDGPVELEYRPGESEFDGSYPSLYERAVNNSLSLEAQTILFNNPELQNKLFEEMTPRIAQDNRNFMTTAESMTGLDHMMQFEERGLDKLFPGATADQVQRLTRYPYITYDDSPESLASSEFGFYRSAGDKLVVYPKRIDLYLKANIGMKRDADGTLSYPFEIDYANPIQEIYAQSVERTAYHELGHMAYDKMIRRNLPFSSSGLLEFSTNMYNTEENYANFVPADILDEKASIDKKLAFAFDRPYMAAKRFKKGTINKLRKRQVELKNLISGYVPDQNHSAMMYYEIERIMNETKDLPIDQRVVARQYISERSLFYIPESRQGEIVRMRMQILKRPENKELLSALRKTDGYQIEATHLYIKPEFYARFAQKNPQLLPALDRFTEEFLTVTREIHAGYSEEFRAALNAEDVYDLPIGSSVRAAAIKNLKSEDSIKRFTDYWGSKDRMYKIPPQADLIRPADYDSEYRPMIVPDSALRQFIYGPEKAEGFAQDAERQEPPAPPPEPTPYERGFLDKILGVTPAY